MPEIIVPNAEVNMQGRVIDVLVATVNDVTPSSLATDSTLTARFWRQVNKTSTCWLWTGARMGRDGYGGLYVKRHQKPGAKYPVSSYAHRVSWELAFGPVPQGAHILHRCDVRSCVNPDHLFLGNQDLNMKDAASKGRLSVPRPRRQKLTTDDLAEIDRLLAEGVLKVRIAERFGVSKCWVTLYAKGERRQYDRTSASQLQRTA